MALGLVRGREFHSKGLKTEPPHCLLKYGSSYLDERVEEQGYPQINVNVSSFYTLSKQRLERSFHSQGKHQIKKKKMDTFMISMRLLLLFFSINKSSSAIVKYY